MTDLASRKKALADLASVAALIITAGPERGDLLDEFERTFYTALKDAKQARGDEGVLRQVKFMGARIKGVNVGHVGARTDTP